jgi:hypothetical protein
MLDTNPVPKMPEWAWGLHVKGSPLAHVNRRYHWHVGRLRAIRSQVHSVVKDLRHREAIIRILDAEIRLVTNEFNSWKKANGYDPN